MSFKLRVHDIFTTYPDPSISDKLINYLLLQKIYCILIVRLEYSTGKLILALYLYVYEIFKAISMKPQGKVLFVKIVLQHKIV